MTSTDAQEALDEAMFALSARLKLSGFLDDGANHAAYERVVAVWTNRRTPPTPATDEREAVARALCEARIRTVRRHDTKPEDLEAMLPASIDYSWRDFVAEADAALSALAPIRAAEILAAEANERARIEADLKDPQIVHMNMLRGGIAKINVTQAMHLNGWTSIDNWHRMTVEQIEDAVKARNEHGAGK